MPVPSTRCWVSAEPGSPWDFSGVLGRDSCRWVGSGIALLCAENRERPNPNRPFGAGLGPFVKRLSCADRRLKVAVGHEAMDLCRQKLPNGHDVGRKGNLCRAAALLAQAAAAERLGLCHGRVLLGKSWAPRAWFGSKRKNPRAREP